MHQVLTNFKKIKRLHLELPVSEINVLDGGGLILKWKVEIQSSADRFAIFTATESSNPDDPYPIGLDLEAYGNDRKWKGEAWFFTALAAAWARNHCLSKIVADYPALETILVTDANGQGVLALDLKQGPNVFKNSLTTWLTSKDITVWILPKLKLPGGMVLDEPILIARDTSTADTVDLSIRNGDNHWILNSFEEPFRTAVNMMMQSELLFIEEL
ncbi:F-box protein At1g30200-like [Zingiber officinale]|nr:F-box protein At1g30200-like [Zingiber officinale]